jgi:uncharacterized protein
MNITLYDHLLEIAETHSHPEDPSHDFSHIKRVLKNVEILAEKEGGDLDVLIPAALFHDVVNYPKNDPRAAKATDESAEWTAELLCSLPEYPANKIEAVYDAISKCSFTKAILPDLLESKILQDADGLESTGAISILRTFASTGQMHRPFYNEEDPFCEQRAPQPQSFALDLFYSRLRKVTERMHTETARKMAISRHEFLDAFLKQLMTELSK